MKKSILDQYNELLFEHDYPEINSLVEFFGVDIRVRSKEEYDYLKREKQSYIDDIEHFYKYLFSHTAKEKREAQRRYPTMCKYFWDSIEERLQDINNYLSSKLSTEDIHTILLTMKSTL